MIAACVAAPILPMLEYMGRRRGQRSGYLYQRSGSWILQWREDVIVEGRVERRKQSRTIAPASGPGAVSRREAQRIAWDEVLAKLDAVSIRPKSMMTVAQFISGRFVPDVVSTMKPAGRRHYDYVLGRHVIPLLGASRLRDVTPMIVQRACQVRLAEGLSTQTVVHVRNAASAVFEHARLLGLYHAENPARLVRLPPMQRVKERHSMTLEQLRALVARLDNPAKGMVILSACTSMNVAEMLGLTWGRVNLGDAAMLVDGRTLPPECVLIDRNFYAGEPGTTKTGNRRRIVPLVSAAVSALREIAAAAKFTAADDHVFSGRTGAPVQQNNVMRRHIKPAGEAIGCPWVSWHVFRRAHAAIAEASDMPLSDRVAQMGHGSPAMTLHYTISDLERRRRVLEQAIGELGEIASG